MNRELLKYLCDPVSREPLRLENQADFSENVGSGWLISESGTRFPIIDGVPRFIEDANIASVESFGDQWNHYNFIDFKINWLEHTVKNTFGDTDYFKDKVIVDCGGGSGAQAKFFLESGAKHVIILELSHSVDGIIKENLKNFDNYDVIQCSIDKPPLLQNSVSGLVYCHNVIQHTESVHKTAKALWSVVGAGGEFVFNCYPKNTNGILRFIRHYFIFMSLRAVISRTPFGVIKKYAEFMGFLRLVPGLGLFLEKSGFCVRGNVPRIKNEGYINRIRRDFRNTVLNTFDAFGSHHYQHYLSDAQIKEIALGLQPIKGRIENFDKYFLRPKPVGIALRLKK